MNADDLTALFARIQPLVDKLAAGFEIRALPGYTNDNFQLRNDGDDWVLRIPREATNRYIDRAAEAHNQTLAHELGIAPQALWRDTEGMTLTPTIRAGRPVSMSDLRDGDTLAAILDPVRRLHQSGSAFRGRLNLADLLERYFALMPATKQEAYRERLQAARWLLPQIEERDPDYVPSHNDLVLDNLLHDGQRLWLIDWEFSAMASPYWDLATLCNSADLDFAQSKQLLQVYCADGPAMEESLLIDYRNLLQLLTDCWMAALVAD